MKHKRLISLLLVAVLALAGAAAVSYARTAVHTGEAPVVSFAGQTLQPVESVFSESVFFGLFSKRTVQKPEESGAEIGILSTATLPLEIDFNAAASDKMENHGGVPANDDLDTSERMEHHGSEPATDDLDTSGNVPAAGALENLESASTIHAPEDQNSVQDSSDATTQHTLVDATNTKRTPVTNTASPCSALLTVWLDEEEIFQGTPIEYEAFRFSENGIYRAELTIECPESEQVSRAAFRYDLTFELDVQPVVLFSSDRARQGDILSVYVNRGFETEMPHIETELGTAIFLPLSPDEFISYIPVNYAQVLGKWMIDVRVGDEAYEQGIIVTGRTYKKQHMTISQSTTDETMNHPDGPKNWEERIKVLWKTHDSEKYWSDTFLRPCEGRISTEFGLYRYTNDNPVPTRHTGIDIAAPAGTPILASNSGRVARAEFVIYTGNTVVIEHGGGLKTYYFHMETLDVEEDDRVERGAVLGTVGSTGYSTGPHLHFEVKIGSHSLSPWEMFDGTSELYFVGIE